jgi:cardiolipin synthase (CMP-forming)
MTFIGYTLLFADVHNWPFRLAAAVCAYASIEEIAISLLVRQPRVDVRSLRHALKTQRSSN